MEPVIHPYNPYSVVEPECPSHGWGDGPCTNDEYYGEGAETYPAGDTVNKPLHYNYGKVETIDYIMQVGALYPGHQAVLVGNVLKYLSRAPLKGDKEKDLKKAQWYLNKLIDTL